MGMGRGERLGREYQLKVVRKREDDLLTSFISDLADLTCRHGSSPRINCVSTIAGLNMECHHIDFVPEMNSWRIMVDVLELCYFGTIQIDDDAESSASTAWIDARLQMVILA